MGGVGQGDEQGQDGPRALGCAPLEVPQIGARLWAAWSERGLLHLSWAAAGAGPAATFGAAHPPQAALPEPYRGVLEAYLQGEPVDPATLPVDPWGTPFQRRVWAALREIPRGRVRSYAAIANAIGSPRAMRAVGGANGKNPVAIAIPCHRVIEAGARLGGYSGGLHIKRFLLALEGARVVGDRVQPGQLELL